MSRLRHYARSLISGYALLAVNTLFTLASVPLALRYLSKAEFGLWAFTSQVAGYLVLLDLGMSGAQSRILIDYKDEKEGTNYGSTLLTGLWVGLTQGALLLVAGGVMLLCLAPSPRFPAELFDQFRWLMFGQCAVLSASLVTRVFANVLWAHQRTDVGNISNIATFAVNFGVLWLGLARGAGVFSLLWAQLAGAAVGLTVTLAACVRLKLLPGRGRWGHATWARFKELFSFGKDVFVFALGSQMITMSQAILITPLLGLEAAGIWSVCIRPFSIVSQLVWRVLDFSATPLSEMLVRGENARFCERFRGITVLTGALAVVMGVAFAACNQSFLQLWTHGKVSWPVGNDVLLALWSLFMSVQRCHTGVLGLKKQLGTVKYVYFVEGLVFIGLATAVAPILGLTGIILSSLVATASISFVFGLWRTKTDFALTWVEVASWLKPAAMTAVILAPLALAMRWLTAAWPALPEFLLCGAVVTLVGGLCLVRLGLDRPMRQRLAERVPSWARELLMGAPVRAGG